MDTKFKYHVFIAHSAADNDIAQELYFSLNQFYKVFCDLESLRPGDSWDVELPKAQRESLLTVVLISPNTEAAYYQREEIAIAIELASQKTGSHRVIPVYVNSDKVPEHVPYGLRVRHGIYLSEWSDLNKVGKKLRKVLNELENQNLMGNAERPILSLLNAFNYGRRNIILSLKRRFHDAFQKVQATYLSDFFCSLAEKHTQGGEFMLALEEISRIHREKKIQLSMVYMDVDGFSQINRKFGREVGDEVVKTVNKLFEGIFHEYYFIQWGKDEFVSFLSDVSEESAQALSESLRDDIRSYAWSRIAPGLYVTASIGVARLKHDERAIDWIVRTIHGSIHAKRCGGNKVESGPFILPPNISRNLRAYIS